MSAANTPAVGFNHNVTYRGKIFHVQTEDTGLPHAHCITHIFLGGNVVATKKTSYADRAKSRDLAKVVRTMMENQHKEMMTNLIHGAYDAKLSGNERAYQPGVLANGSLAPALLVGGAKPVLDPKKK